MQDYGQVDSIDALDFSPSRDFMNLSPSSLDKMPFIFDSVSRDQNNPVYNKPLKSFATTMNLKRKHHSLSKMIDKSKSLSPSCSHSLEIKVMNENIIKVKDLNNSLSQSFTKYYKRSFLLMIDPTFTLALKRYKPLDSGVIKIQRIEGVNCSCYNALINFNSKNIKRRILTNKSAFFISEQEIKISHPTLYDQIYND